MEKNMCNLNDISTNKSINEQIKELFDNDINLKERNDFAYDGIINEEIYSNQDLKVAFLLKEVNGSNSKDKWSLAEWLASLQNDNENKTWKKTWLNVCYWCEILKDLNVNFSDIYAKTEEEITKILHNVAVVNIKKKFGCSKSIYEELQKAIKDYGDLTLYEIEKIIQPKLVICCGTFKLAQSLFQTVKQKTVQTKTLSCGTEYFIEDGIYYLKFVHPAWYVVNNNILFAYAKVTFAEILSEIKNTSCIDK